MLGVLVDGGRLNGMVGGARVGDTWLGLLVTSVLHASRDWKTTRVRINTVAEDQHDMPHEQLSGHPDS